MGESNGREIIKREEGRKGREREEGRGKKKSIRE